MGIVRILASLSLRVSSHWTIAQAKLLFGVSDYQFETWQFKQSLSHLHVKSFTMNGPSNVPLGSIVNVSVNATWNNSPTEGVSNRRLQSEKRTHMHINSTALTTRHMG